MEETMSSGSNGSDYIVAGFQRIKLKFKLKRKIQSGFTKDEDKTVINYLPNPQQLWLMEENPFFKFPDDFIDWCEKNIKNRIFSDGFGYLHLESKSEAVLLKTRW